MEHDSYDPNRLLDAVMKMLELKNDAALAHTLGVTPPTISRVRHKTLPVGATLLVSMHEETGLSVRQLRDLIGDRRKHRRGYKKRVEKVE